jgi:phosphoenolpyruvate carboxykinase (ATP)
VQEFSPIPHSTVGLDRQGSCPGVPGDVLAPRGTWPDPAAYDAQASRLAELFRKNFQQFDGVTASVRDSGPVRTLSGGSARAWSGAP